MITENADLHRLVDMAAIRSILAMHSRGIDRAQVSIFAHVYHDNATVNYGFFNGPAEEFALIVTTGEDHSPSTLHRTSNMLINLGADTALSESYVMAYSPGEGQQFIGGRYLDTHKRKDGQWKLEHRLYVLDWNMNWPNTGSAAENFIRPNNFGNTRDLDPSFQQLQGWQPREGVIDMSTEQLLIAVQEALAKQDIHDLVMAQARATDRMDLQSLQSLWHPDAQVDIGMFAGSAADYCPWIIDVIGALIKGSHNVANEWIKVSGNSGIAESYVMTFVTSQDDKGDRWDELSGGRYLDEFECLAGTWKFTKRCFISDWTTRHPCSDQSDEGMYAALTTRGDKFPDDPVFSHWDNFQTKTP